MFEIFLAMKIYETYMREETGQKNIKEQFSIQKYISIYKNYLAVNIKH